MWLDGVETDSPTDLWLELSTTDLPAVSTASRAGIEPCDEIEPIVGAPFESHWINNPAGTVHLVADKGQPRDRQATVAMTKARSTGCRGRRADARRRGREGGETSSLGSSP